ncbi:MAG: PEP-CTERM sorting domain-containing protein [Pirellulales bacterium]
MTKYRTIDCIVLLSALVTCTGFRDAAATTPPAYTVTDLGTLGGTSSIGRGINASGHVTGESYMTGDAAFHAFLYDGAMHDLGTLGGTNSYGYGINDSGQVTGQSDTTGGAHAFLYDSTMHDLGTLGGSYSYGIGINASGQVSGYSQTTGGAAHAFLYDGTMNDLGTLGGTDSFGWGINDSGQMTGFSKLIGDAEWHAFLYDGTLHDLGTLGGTQSEGHGINASGHVAGTSYATEGSYHAFLYDGTMNDLGVSNSYGFGINGSGQVVGYFGNVAFLYTSGSGLVDLNSLIDPSSGWELSTALAINDAGQITGWGLIGGQQHAYLLTPVPEPTSLALLALGLPLLAWRNSRRFGTGGVRDFRRYAIAAATRAVAFARSDQ